MTNKNFLSKIRGLFKDSQSSDVSLDCRLTVGSPSGFNSKLMLKLVSVLVLILTLGVGNAWGVTATYVNSSNGTACTVNGTAGMKLGTNKVGGAFTITVPANATKLTLRAAAWNGVSGLSLNITPAAKVSPSSLTLTANTGIAGNSPFTLSGGSDETDYQFDIALSSITTSTTLTFTTSTTKRCASWGARYVFNPTSPTNGTPTSNSEHVSWSYANSTDKYEIYYSTSNSTPTAGTSASIGINTIGTTKSADLTGLTANTTYYWWVRAVDPDGYCKSAWVAGSSFTTSSGSCTAPSSVSISGTTKYLGGQTISLTATPTGGSGTTTYQWEKKISGTWTPLSNGTTAGVTISGATTNNLTISPCTHENSGGYRCVVSTGATCSTKSHADDNAGYGVHVFSIHGKYSDGDYEDHEITWTSGTTGTKILHLNAKKTYLFKVWSNNGYYYGHGTNANEDFMFQPTTWDCGVDNREMRLFTTVEGDYTFTVNIEHGLDGSPYVNLQIGYPSMTHPNTGYVYVQKFSWRPYLHYWYNNDNVLSTWGNDPQLNADQYIEICGTEYWCVPVIDYYCNFIAKDAAGDPSNTTGDQHTNSPHPGQRLYNDGSWKWGDFVKYTITFAGNGNTDGSTPSVEDICPGSNATLTANGFIKTGYTFDGWTPSANVTVGSTTYTPSDVVPGGSIIKSVSGNLTMTAHWTEDLHDVTVEYKCGATTVSSSTTIENVGITTTGTTTAPASFTGYSWSTWSAMPTGVTTSTTPLTTRAIVINATADGKTITANYMANQYSITYKDEGDVAYSGNGTAGVPTGAPTTHTYGSATALVNGSKTGYDFGGWFTDKECTVSAGPSIGATAITADITLYAKWTLHTYTISSTLNNCTSDPSIPSSYTYTGTAAGLNYTLTANSGYALPASVTVSGVTYTWNQATGVLALTGTISSDVSITVTALPQVTWMAGGSVFNTQSGTAGTALSNPGTPSNSTYCDGIKVFVGWSASTINGTTDTKPADLFSSAAATKKTIPAGGTTYYAVFATAGGTPTVYTKVTSVDAGTYVLVSEKTADTYMYMPNTTSSGSNPSLGSDITMSTTLGVTTLTNDISDDMLWDLTTGETSGYFYVRPHGSSTIGLGTTASTGANIRISSTYVDTEWRFATSNDYGWEIYNGSMYLAVYSDSYWRNYSNNSTNQNGTFYMFKQSGGVTYSAYATTCAECTTAATVGAATLKGDFSLSSVGVTCPTSGTAVGTNCSWLDYGFVWSPSSNTTPTIGGTNCTKVQTGTTGSSNTWDDDLESTFVVGNTYYYRAYGKNGKAESDFVYGTVNSFIPRSVTFNLNGHGSSTPSTQYVPNGGKAADPSYSEVVAGWTFGGWYDNADWTQGAQWNFGTSTVSGASVTLYAKWTEKPKYTITLNAGNGTISDVNWTNTSGSTYTRKQANGDEEITLPTPSCNCAGWVFQGWSTTSKDNAASFTPDKEDGASFVPAADVTYYAVYRANATGGTTFNKITSTGDLTTGNYIFMSSSGYAMKNVVTSSQMDEVGGYTASNSSQTIDNANLVWTIAKFSSQVVIKNGANYLGIDANNEICLTTTPHFFTYTYNAGSSRWEFTSATKTSYQLVYSSYFKILTSQSTAIYLYKQGAGLTGNYYTNPDCSDISVTGVVSPEGSGTVTLTAGSGKTGDKVYAMYTPDEDYNFDEWSISGTGSTLGSTTAVVTEITIGSANTTVTANFVAKDWKTITWKANGVALTGGDLGSASVKVENGFNITNLPPEPSSCDEGDGASDQFMGWVEDSENWSGKTNDLSEIHILKKLADFPTVTDNVTYHAVWAAIDETTNEWVKVTAVDDLNDGETVAFISAGDAYYLPNAASASGNAPTATAVTKTSGNINFVDAMKFTAIYNSTYDGFTFESESATGKYLWAYNNNKGIYVYANNDGQTTGSNIWYVDDFDATNTASTGYGIGIYAIDGASNHRYLTTYAHDDWRSYTSSSVGATAQGKSYPNIMANIYRYAKGHKKYMTKCCEDPELAFDGEYNYQTLVRQDIHGARGGNGSATAEQGKATLVLDYSTESDGTCTVEVKKLTGGDNRSTAVAGSDCSNHTSIAINESTKKVTFDVWTYAGSYPTANGQGTYRIKITQAATSTYCEAVTYYFVDVTLRDKFVDAVNGNTTINVDGQSKTTSDKCKTPTEASLDGDKNDDCHSTTRRFLGWVREDNMDTWYGSSSDRTRDLDDKKDDAALVAPNADIITSGSTWYAIWGIEE